MPDKGMPDEIGIKQIAIEVPPKAGAILSVVFTWEHGFTSYFPYEFPSGDPNERDDWGHSVEWYIEAIHGFLNGSAELLSLPQQMHKGWVVYITRDALRRQLRHIHLAWTESPLAKREHAGEKILVPMPSTFVPHGPGKRR